MGLIHNVTTGPESVAVQEPSGMWLIRPLAHGSPFPYMRPVRWLVWLWWPVIIAAIAIPTYLIGLAFLGWLFVIVLVFVALVAVELFAP